jgi:hypothetical protein
MRTPARASVRKCIAQWLLMGSWTYGLQPAAGETSRLDSGVGVFVSIVTLAPGMRDAVIHAGRAWLRKVPRVQCRVADADPTGVSRQNHHPERMEITQPRVARHELPWEHASQAPFYPERVISARAQAGGTVEMRPDPTGVSCRYRHARRSPDVAGARPFGWTNAAVALEPHQSTTIAVPEYRLSCKDVVSMLQACCRLVGSFILLSPSRSPGRAPTRSGLRAAQPPARPSYRS